MNSPTLDPLKSLPLNDSFRTPTPSTLPQQAKDVIRDIYWNVCWNNFDCVIVFSGRERLGKSTLAMNVWLYLDELRAKWKLPLTFDVRKIGLTSEEYANKIDASREIGDVVMYDEAATGMYNRESMGTTNRELNKILVTCGYKNLVHLLSLPSLFALDKEVRHRRVGLLFEVKARLKQVTHTDGEKYMKIDKGWFDIYNADDVKKIWRHHSTGEVYHPKTRCRDLHFGGLQGTPEWAAYEVASLASKSKFISNSAGKISKKANLHGIDTTGVSTLSEYDAE